MSKVKLELQDKDNDALLHFATTHADSLVGNVTFADVVPDATIFDTALGAFSSKITEISDAEVALASMRADREALRLVLEGNLRERGMSVQSISGGDEGQILSVGFEVQSASEPTTNMAKPYDLHAKMGDNPGEVNVGCHAVARARSYIYEMRDHIDSEAPGPWEQKKLTTRSSMDLDGMTPGLTYGFRIRALGPNDLESPWSDEVTCMAP